MTIANKSRVVVTGIGPATVLVAAGDECALYFVACSDVTVRDLRAESGNGSGEKHLMGTLSFLGCSDVTVRDCQVSCPDNMGRDQSAVYVASQTSPGAQFSQDSGHVRVLRNRIEVGDQQSGVLITSVDESLVADNEIRLSAVASPTQRPLVRVVDELARFVGKHVDILVSAAQAQPRPRAAVKGAERKAAGAAEAEATVTAAGGHPVVLPNDTTMVIRGASQIQRLADQFGRGVNAKALAHSTPRQQFERYVRRAVLAPKSLELSESNSRFVFDAVGSSRAMSQGIVIGGHRANLVRISGNLVSGAIQGVHVGLSGPGGAKFTAGQVMVRDNVVQSTVPFFWLRTRHAYYIGSFDRLTMTDNAASLTRIGASSVNLASVQASAVEAVRIHGRLGQWLSIRGVELTGPFTTGVAIQPSAPVGIWPALQRYVCDVLNSGQTGPALTPATIPHDRCAP